MESLFTTLTDAMNGRLLAALFASCAWGALSILLSPCHLSAIPLVIGFLVARHEKTGTRGVLLSLVFGLGILMTIAMIGAITAALGRILGDVGPYGTSVVGAIIVIVGLYLMDLIRLPESGVILKPPMLQSAYLSALILGLIFGIALGPCTFAFMAPVLGVVFRLSETSTLAAGAMLLSFGLGHAGVIAASGGVTARVQAYLDWTNRSNAVLWTKRVAGFLVLLGGIYLIFFS